MTRSLLILADDLSGAADCAVACRRAGMEARVCLDAPGAAACDGAVAIDLDSRPRTRAEARAATAAAAPLIAGRALYRKIDSTLRGHVALEIAATLELAGPDAFAVVCPAYPATGRTVVGGHVHVNATPLGQTEIWRLGGQGEPDLVSMLIAAGLAVGAADLQAVRGDLAAALQAHRAAGARAIVCDAETEADLQAIVAASLPMAGATWAGSGGMAIPLAAALAPDESAPAPVVARREGPHLVAVGSASSVSRGQLAVLAEDPRVGLVLVSPRVLLDGPEAPGWRPASRAVVAAIRPGRDVVAVAIDPAAPVEPELGPALAQGLGHLLGRQLGRFSTLTATGGETARALLAVAGARALRIACELQPGVVLSMLEGRALPVVTKAGAYGDPQTLARVIEAMRALPLA
jgi:uncharacterized protein YgbK (DUF1537 family)